MSDLKLQPKTLELETTTVWSFPKRGDWATHGNNAKYRGNWAPQIPHNLILRYSKPGDLILDPMCGSGTTLIESKLLGRNAIGYDINPASVKIAQENLNLELDEKNKKVSISLEVGDTRHLAKIKNDFIDLIATHPPYVDIIKYSEGKIEDDLSNIHDLDKFCLEIKKAAQEFYRVLKPGKYCAILIGDTRRKKYFQPLAYKVMQTFLEVGFKLKEDIIKHQWNCKTTPYWSSMSKNYNFLLIMHEHLFVFEK